MSMENDVQLFIGGRWIKTGNTLPIINPADEKVVGTVAVAAIANLEDAIAEAERGFRIWSRTSPARRAQIILKAASLMRERQEEIARCITL